MELGRKPGQRLVSENLADMKLRQTPAPRLAVQAGLGWKGELCPSPGEMGQQESG